MVVQDEEYPLDSLLEMGEPAPRRWLTGLISITGLAAFVGVAWYVYKPKLDFIPDLSIPAVPPSRSGPLFYRSGPFACRGGHFSL